jgi:hypothetical protein
MPDVCDTLCSDGGPFDTIMHRVGPLAPGQSLRLLTTFRPVSLFALWRVMEEPPLHGGEGQVASGASYPRVGSIVSDLTCPAGRLMAFYNQYGTGEQHIKKG